VLLNLPLAPVWAKLLRTPRPYLYAGILFFASMGAYAVNGQPFDLILLLALGLLGFVMRRFGLPVLPLIVAVILGPRIELQGRRALQLSSGEWRGLFGSTNPATGEFELSPIAVTIYVIIVIILAWPLIFKAIRRILPAKAAAVVDEVSHEPALAIAEHHPVGTSEAELTAARPLSDKETRDVSGDRADPEQK
jgi:putative tricarboxylic transport membrane protein